jgi:uncharacterized protein
MTKIKTVGVIGGSGLIGRAVVNALIEKGYTVFIYGRGQKRPLTLPEKVEYITTGTAEKWCLPERNLDIIIHLAGESIMGWWSAAKKKKIRDSRVLLTKAVVEAIAEWKTPPKKWMIGSAIGIYAEGDQEHSEHSQEYGEGFLAKLVQDWEKVAGTIKQRWGALVELMVLRTGLVLSAEGGLFPPQKMAGQLGLASQLADGNQWMSWIHIQDYVRMLIWILELNHAEGVWNMVAPEAVQQRVFVKELSILQRRPLWLKVPAILLKMINKDFANDVLLSNIKVIPQRAMLQGFEFKYTKIKQAFADILQ